VGPKTNQKWGILKYLSAEIFFEKSNNIPGQRVYECRILGQKLGYDKCPYLSFFVRRFEDEIFELTGWRDLNTEYVIFDLRCYEMLMMSVWMQNGKDDLTRMRNNNGIPKFVKEKDLTPLGGKSSFTGKMIVYYRIALER